MIEKQTSGEPSDPVALARKRRFIKQAYPDADLESVSDPHIEAIFDAFPLVMRSDPHWNRPGARLDLGVHLRRLNRWVAGEWLNNIAMDDHVGQTAVIYGRLKLARFLSRTISFDGLVVSAGEEAQEKLES